MIKKNIYTCDKLSSSKTVQNRVKKDRNIKA